MSKAGPQRGPVVNCRVRSLASRLTHCYLPGGSIWFTGLAEIGRIGPDGAMYVWHQVGIGAALGLPDALAVGQGGEVWYTDDSGRICRIRPSLKFDCYATHPATRDILMRGLAMGSDGALWFTEDNLTSVADTQMPLAG